MSGHSCRPLFVFPMAGLSRRFREAGFDKPKYMLPAHGKPVFDHVISGFSDYFRTHDFLFICRDEDDTPFFIEDRVARLGVPDGHAHIVVLGHSTEGQAETVALGLDRAAIWSQAPITIFNIDTIHQNFRFPPADIMACDGYLEVFRGDGEHWSFVRPGEGSEVLEVTEKVRISDLCSSGLYHFKSASLFVSAYDEQRKQLVSELMGRERYVAPLYNSLLQSGARIHFHLIDRNRLIFCGVPKEYNDFLRIQEIS